MHRAPDGLRCHYCDHREAIPSACVQCGGAVQFGRGVGTQQLERLVAERYPTARVARMDLDTTGGKGAHERILAAVDSGDVDILLGTQMIAKGLDFPLSNRDIVYVHRRPFVKAQELLEASVIAFIRSFLVTYAGNYIGPFIKEPLVPVP